MAAGIPLVPTHPVDPYAAAVQQANQRYPRFAQFPIAMTKGTGPGYSETYAPQDEDNPKPGNWTIQLRSPEALKEKNLADVIGFEMIHALQAKDPRYQAFTNQFVGMMTPQQKAAAQAARQNDIKVFGPDPRSFDDWLRQVQAQEYIRGAVFNKIIPNWIGPHGEGQYTPEQMKLMDQIGQYLRSSD